MKKHLIISAFGLLAFATVAGAQSYTFSADLYLGSQGNDVAALQTFLIGKGYAIPSVTSGATAKGYFGNQTKQALAAFQNSVGITPNGYFGPITRSWINTHGNANNGGDVIISPTQPQQPTYPTYPSYPSYPTNPAYPSYPNNNYGTAPTISGIDAPTTLNINQIGTWTIHASDPQNSYLTYSVDWGDSSNCPVGYACQASAPNTAAFVQQTSFTHSYANTGLYTVKFTVRNVNGYTAQSSATVQVTNGISNGGGAGALRITSPNGGEILQKGTFRNITWTSPYYFAAANADLKVMQTYNCTGQICPMIAYAPYTIATNIPINQNTYAWNVGQASNYNGVISTLADGQYTVQICQSGTSNCDSSDSTFTITSSTVYNQNQITLTSPNGGEVWQANSIHPINWNYANSGYYNNAVDIYLGKNLQQPCIAIYPAPASCTGSFQPTYTLDRNISSNSTYNWVVGTDINNNTIPAGSYVIEVCPAGSTTSCDTSDSYFTISGSAYPYYQNTTVNNGSYYTPPTYGTGSYGTGYNSVTGCPPGYMCTPVSTTGATYSY